MKDPIVITPPDLLAVLPLDYVKQHARIEYVDDDSLITGWLWTAYKVAEDYQRRTLLTTTYQVGLDCFPSGAITVRPPVVSVDEIAFVDSSGNDEQMDLNTVDVDPYCCPGKIYPYPGNSWPNLMSGLANAVTLTYTAGSSSLTPNTVSAICLLVSFLNENREAASELSLKQIPFGVKTLLKLDSWGSYS